MKLNNKGFAASGVLYTLLLLFLVLIVNLLSMFSNRKLILEQLKKSIMGYTYKKYENGTIVYFNPITGLKCSIDDYNENVDDLGVSIGSNSNTKEGCMKWYIFNDDEKSKKVNLLLDHNIVSSLSYESNDNINEKLLESTEIWNENISGIELLSVNDIKKITNNINFDISNILNKYYFETNTSEVPSEYKNYGWLYDRTGNNCKDTGCKNNSNDDITGYLTSDTLDNKVWVVNKDGSLMTTDFTTDTYGLRPAISIEKNLIRTEILN